MHHRTQQHHLIVSVLHILNFRKFQIYYTVHGENFMLIVELKSFFELSIEKSCEMLFDICPFDTCAFESNCREEQMKAIFIFYHGNVSKTWIETFRKMLIHDVWWFNCHEVISLKMTALWTFLIIAASRTKNWNVDFSYNITKRIHISLPLSRSRNISCYLHTKSYKTAFLTSFKLRVYFDGNWHIFP